MEPPPVEDLLLPSRHSAPQNVFCEGIQIQSAEPLIPPRRALVASVEVAAAPLCAGIERFMPRGGEVDDASYEDGAVGQSCTTSSMEEAEVRAIA